MSISLLILISIIYDINKFILFLEIVVYPYEYLDDWEKFNETSLPEKEIFLQSPKHGRCY